MGKLGASCCCRGGGGATLEEGRGAKLLHKGGAKINRTYFR